jgi:hypothetical protein
MAKAVLQGVVISVSFEKRQVVVDRTPDELAALEKDGKTEKDVGPKLDVVDDVVGRVAVAGYNGGPRPDVFPQFSAPIEVWGLDRALLGKTVEVTVEVSD